MRFSQKTWESLLATESLSPSWTAMPTSRRSSGLLLPLYWQSSLHAPLQGSSLRLGGGDFHICPPPPTPPLALASLQAGPCLSPG